MSVVKVQPSRLSSRLMAVPGRRLNRLRTYKRSTRCFPVERRAESGKKGTVMLNGPKGTENDSIAPCSVCGHLEELFELPGRAEKCCLECSADMATAMLLSTEIDAATLAGRSTEALVSEFPQVSSRMLERSQSA